MKISELIEQLAGIAADHGDLEVELGHNLYYERATEAYFGEIRDTVIIA